MPARAVTVIVPIYDDWRSLQICIASILDSVNLDVHSVVLVNDCGPNADEIEGNVLEAVAGRSAVSYHRNPTNLGFVGTCNRAVYELDLTDNDVLLLNSDAALTPGALEELVQVLYAAEHHGAVCPRSNNASIASIPFFRRHINAVDDKDESESRHVFDVVSSLLPRWYISPVAVGFCLLIRRSLIENYGLFDPIFGLGYNEENDLCLRINAAGFSSLIANRAFVSHVGSSSFSPEVKKNLDPTNHAKLLARYPFYLEAVSTFIGYNYAAADVFAEILASTEQMSILVDINHLSHVYNGSTRYALSFLKTLSHASLPPNVSVTVAAQPESISFFKLDRYGLTVLPYREVTGVYDVGIALAPLNNINQLIQLNNHCARWVVSHFDMIAARAWNLMLRDPMRPAIVEQGLAHADRVIAISNFSLNDAAAFYPSLADELTKRGEGVHLGSTRDTTGERFGDAIDDALPQRIQSILEEDSYLVVLGNSYPHKQVALAARALESINYPVIAFGPIEGLAETSTRAIVTSGVLSDSKLARILEGAAVIVFPSAYEGYGLPVADSLDFGVPIVAFDTAVAQEVVDGLGGHDAVRFFTRFDQLADTVTTALKDPALHAAAAELRHRVRGLDPFGERLIQIALDQLDQPLDIERLDRRYREIKRMERIVSLHRNDFEFAWRDVMQSESFKIGHRIVRIVSPVLRLFRRRSGRKSSLAALNGMSEAPQLRG